MKYILRVLLLLMSITGCVRQEGQTNNATKDQTEKHRFVWDFNSEKNYIYSFKQEVISVNNWGKESEDIDTSRVIGTGDLKVKSKGDNKADFVLILTIQNDAFKSFKDEMSPQTMVIPDMDANGQFESQRRNSELIFDLILPLPSRDLEIGESENLDLEIPFNLMGSPLYVKGHNKLKYLKDTAPNTALIRSEFKVDKLDIPEEIQGEFGCSIVGESELEFNYKEKHFESSNVNVLMKMKSKTEDMEMSLENTSKYNIKFIKIEG